MIWKRKLDEWGEENLLSQEQKEAILSYEASKQATPYALYGFITLGIVAIAIGFVSLIAFNWEILSDEFKLTANFAFLGGIVFAVYYSKTTGRNRLFEAFTLLYILLILASIGHISQIFHTSGAMYQALFLWTGITLPVVLFTESRTGIHLWITGFTLAVTSFIIEYVEFSGNYRYQELALYYLNAFFPAGYFLTGVLLLPLSGKGRISTSIPRAFLFWSFLMTLYGTITASILPGPDKELLKLSGNYPLIAMGIALAVAIISWFFLKKNLRIAGILTGTALLYLLFFYPQYQNYDSPFFNAVLFLLIWLLLAFLAIIIQYKRVFDILLAGMGIRFLVIYFEVLGDMASTGFGLILSGMVIIGSAYAFMKYRNTITGLVATLARSRESQSE